MRDPLLPRTAGPAYPVDVVLWVGQGKAAGESDGRSSCVFKYVDEVGPRMGRRGVSTYRFQEQRQRQGQGRRSDSALAAARLVLCRLVSHIPLANTWTDGVEWDRKEN